MNSIKYNYLKVGQLESLGNEPVPFIDIKFDECVENVTGDDWNKAGEIYCDLSGEIRKIEAHIDVIYVEETRSKDTPSFTSELIDDSGETHEKITLSSRDFLGEQDRFDYDIITEVPLSKFVGTPPYIQEFELNLRVDLKRESWGNGPDEPDLYKKATIKLIFNIKSDATFILDPEVPTSELELKCYRGGGIDIITGSDVKLITENVTVEELSSIIPPSFYTQSQNTMISPSSLQMVQNVIKPDFLPISSGLMQVSKSFSPVDFFEGIGNVGWNDYYEVGLNVTAIEDDTPAIVKNKVIVKYQEDLIEKIEVVSDLTFEETLGSSLDVEPILWVYFSRDRHAWKWYREVDSFYEANPELIIGGDFGPMIPDLFYSNFQITGPLEKKFIWESRLYEKGNPANLLAPTKTLTIIIRVPQGKINSMKNSIKSADLGYMIGWEGVIIGAAVAICCTGPWGVVAGIIIAVAGCIAGTLLSSSARTHGMNTIADCSIDFDHSYESECLFQDFLDQFERLGEDIPQVLSVFFKACDNVKILSNAMRVIFGRYLSAKVKEDDEAAILQYQSSLSLMDVLEAEILKVKNHLEEVKTIIKESKQDYEDSMIQFGTIINQDGINADIKELLINNGLPEEFITQLEEQDLNNLEINQEQYDQYFNEYDSNCDTLFENSVTLYLDSVGFMRDIRRVMNLEGSDLWRVLYNYGLLTYKQLNSKLEIIGMSHPLSSIGIFHPVRNILADLHINTTAQYLEAASTPSKRRQLDTILDDGNFEILKSANIADLLRIEGMTEIEAIDLEFIGVDTVKELTHRNSNNLHKSMFRLYEERGYDYSIEKKVIESWISKAEKLEPVLKY